MTRLNKALSPASNEELAQLALALSHPIRLTILHLMADRKRRLSGEITAALPELPRTTVSQHIVALRKSGLLDVEVEGLTVSYWINPKNAPTRLRHLRYFCMLLARCPVCEQSADCACFVDGVQRRHRI